jgi:hypothetical protein
LVALVVWLVLGRVQWFAYDDWDFLAARRVGDFGDLMRPHAGVHWSTVPILVYRMLWWIVGIRSYLPYQVVIVLLHLGVAALLRLVMTRAGVRPWTATAASTLFVFFGAGYDDVVWSFQIGFVGSLAFGLVALLLIDHDGRLGWRDAASIGAGLLSLMCSSVGLCMVGVLALSALIRRGWRIALAVAGPLAVVYVVWALSFDVASATVSNITFGAVARFVVTDVHATFKALAQVPALDAIMAAALVVGVALRTRQPDARARLAAPVAMLAGVVAFYAITALGRVGATGFGSSGPVQSRWIYIGAALAVPAIAVGADAVAVAWPRLTLILFVVLLIGIPGNVVTLADRMHDRGPFERRSRQLVLALASAPVAPKVPRDLQPDVLAPQMTVGWLIDGVRSGRIPPVQLNQFDAASADLLESLRGSSDAPPSGGCSPLRAATTVTLRLGQSLGLDGAGQLWIYTYHSGIPVGRMIVGAYPYPRTVVSVVSSIRLDVVPITHSPRVCLPEAVRLVPAQG